MNDARLARGAPVAGGRSGLCVQPDLQRSLSTYTTCGIGTAPCTMSCTARAAGSPAPMSRNWRIATVNEILLRDRRTAPPRRAMDQALAPE
jgi:hypothetical protein